VSRVTAPVLISAFLALLIPSVLLVPPVGAQGSVVVWSDQPDMAFFAEVYNATHDHGILVRFKDNLASSMVQEAPEADLLVGTYLNSPIVRTGLRSLEPVLESIPEPPSALLLGIPQERTPVRLLPVAYQLPAIIINPAGELRVPPVFITMDDLAVNAHKFNRYFENGSPRRLAFVPRYNPLAKYYLLRVLGTSFSASAEEEIQWNRNEFDDSVTALFDWVTGICGSRTDESEFVEKYLYDPVPQQFARNRIGFAFSSSGEILHWNNLGNTDFRWLASDDHRIPVMDDIVWAGIPASAARSDAAEEFLVWLFTPETQEFLIQAKAERRIPRFGLFGGFSTLSSINTGILTTLYPQLQGRLVPDDLLTAPPLLPRYWNEAIREVLLPLLQDQNISPQEMSGALSGRMNQWYLQRGD